MCPTLCRGVVCLTFLVASALGFAAEPVVVPKSGAPAPDSTLDQFIASAKRQAETGTTEFKQLVAQLDPLKTKQQTLLATRRAKEAELARLQSAGGNAQRITALQQEIEACRNQLNVVDTQFQVLIYRIQSGPMPFRTGLVPASGGTGAAAGPTPGRLTRTVPPEKIKASADALLRSPAPSAAAARAAATEILSASQPGFTHVEVDQLAQLILQLASQANEAELHAELTALKQANEKKSGPRAADQAGNELKFEIRLTPTGDQDHLRELQARQAKLEQASIELLKKSGATPDKPSPAKK